ncbi:hypothetical protein [Metaclostridioides mangenotii]|nr:hypothetical protein [Clostridioides mangenotii]
MNNKEIANELSGWIKFIRENKKQVPKTDKELATEKETERIKNAMEKLEG